MPPFATVAIPTLAASTDWLACIEALAAQTFADFEAVIVDNSGENRAAAAAPARPWLRIIANPSNEGFGAAINRAWAGSQAPYLATLNDDARPHPGWLEALVRALESDAGLGMAAPQVRLHPSGLLDSAGLGLAADGTAKQRGHGRPPESVTGGACLMPSGSASLWRRAAIEQTGGFDGSYFLYCEDADLGLRARWLGWRCVYVPEAVVEHHYSASAGRASALKAYLVERNRLRTALKCLPASWLWRAPFASAARYFWHVRAMRGGRGVAAAFVRSGEPAWRLGWLTLKAHLALAPALPGLWRARRAIMESRRVTPAAFRAMLEEHRLSLKEVASQ